MGVNLKKKKKKKENCVKSVKANITCTNLFVDFYCPRFTCPPSYIFDISFSKVNTVHEITHQQTTGV